MQTDRRFSYFPPEFTQPGTLPNAWNPMISGTSQSHQMAAPPPTQAPQPAIADPSYFMQAGAYSFGAHLYGEGNFDTEMRHGSLSQQQQLDLLQSLETDGLTEIDNFMNFTNSGYESSIKL
jgi:hypothetical protein